MHGSAITGKVRSVIGLVTLFRRFVLCRRANLYLCPPFNLAAVGARRPCSEHGRWYRGEQVGGGGRRFVFLPVKFVSGDSFQTCLIEVSVGGFRLLMIVCGPLQGLDGPSIFKEYSFWCKEDSLYNLRYQDVNVTVVDARRSINRAGVLYDGGENFQIFACGEGGEEPFKDGCRASMAVAQVTGDEGGVTNYLVLYIVCLRIVVKVVFLGSFPFLLGVLRSLIARGAVVGRAGGLFTFKGRSLYLPRGGVGVEVSHVSTSVKVDNGRLLVQVLGAGGRGQCLRKRQISAHGRHVRDLVAKYRGRVNFPIANALARAARGSFLESRYPGVHVRVFDHCVRFRSVVFGTFRRALIRVTVPEDLQDVQLSGGRVMYALQYYHLAGGNGGRGCGRARVSLFRGRGVYASFGVVHAGVDCCVRGGTGDLGFLLRLVPIGRAGYPQDLFYLFFVVHRRGGHPSIFLVRPIGRFRGFHSRSKIRIANQLIDGSGLQVTSGHANGDGALTLAAKRLEQRVARPIAWPRLYRGILYRPLTFATARAAVGWERLGVVRRVRQVCRIRKLGRGSRFLVARDNGFLVFRTFGSYSNCFCASAN